MLYITLKVLLRITLKVFFKKLITHYKSTLPKSGPAIIVANHPSTFLDPLIIASITKRKVFFLAKGSLFTNGVVKFIFKHFNMIPVYRAQDDAGKMDKNNESFDKCYEHLEKGGLILIFPEGVSITEKKLKPIKTGAARIALGAEARNGFNLGVNIFTIGLNYENPHQFRKNVVVNIGTPIKVADFKSYYETHPHYASVLLTQTITKAIEELIIDIDDKEQEHLTDALFDIYRHTINNEELPFNENSLADFQLQKNIAAGVHYFAMYQFDRYQKMRERVYNYQMMLKNLNLSERDFYFAQNQKITFKQVVQLLVFFPLFVSGFVFNYLPFIIAPKIAKMVCKELEYQGPISMISGMFLYLINYTLLTVLFCYIISPTWLATLFTMSLFLSGLVAYWYSQSFLILQNKWRLMRLFFLKNSLVVKLITEREAIIEEIDLAKSEYYP